MHDPILDEVKESPARYRAVIEAMPVDCLCWSNGGWSICAVLTHLAFGEVYYRQRYQRMINEDGVAIFKYAAAEMIPNSGPPNISPLEMLHRWETFRAETVQMLEQSPQSALNNTGVHSERGKVTLRSELEHRLIHDNEHLEQIKAIYHEWEARLVRK
jgi:hypothetical protein